MSSAHPSGGPSQPAEPELGLAAILRIRGAPLLEALEHHHEGARDHAEATASYAFAIAAELGRDRAQSEVAREAAKLHEVGHVYVPVATLAKPPGERSEDDERALAGAHEAAYRLARGAGIPEPACGWLLRFRERWDGRGPEGLGGEQIPIESRLMRTACVCQTALAAPGNLDPRRHAIEQLGLGAAAELDPRVVAATIAVLERAAAG